MDILTHLCLGTCLAGAVSGTPTGKKVLLAGALIQSLPDVDTLASVFCQADTALLIHRGFTHSLFFALTMGACLALIARRRWQFSLFYCLLFCCGQLIVHDLIDVCNAYGTGLLEPFVHTRFSVHLLYVVDPLFSISLFAGALILVFMPFDRSKRKAIGRMSILISGVYVVVALVFRVTLLRRVEHVLKSQAIQYQSYQATPAPFNSILWFVIVKTNQGYYITYRSVCDRPQRPWQFTYHPQNQQLLTGKADAKALRRLEAFAGDWYAIDTARGNTFFNVLRFGQVQGWRNPHAPFVLRYPLTEKADPALLQKARLDGWNAASVRAYVKRIQGY